MSQISHILNISIWVPSIYVNPPKEPLLKVSFKKKSFKEIPITWGLAFHTEYIVVESLTERFFCEVSFLYDKPVSIQSFRILHQTITVTNLSRNVTVWDSRYSRCTFSNCKSRNLVWRQVTATFKTEKENTSREFFSIQLNKEWFFPDWVYPSRTLRTHGS